MMRADTPQIDESAHYEAFQEFGEQLFDWNWRITSGALYKIKVKSPEPGDTAGLEMPFRPNVSQIALISALWNRNVVLKARQMGFSTLIDIMALDHALWNRDQNVVVIAHNTDAAEELFRDKIKYAYDRLPDSLRDNMPLEKQTQSSLIFAHNNSSIRVVTSARSGTVHFLHVSEMGKIAAKFPEKAREITTGSLQAVPIDGISFIESTAEGQAGAFYEIAKRAEAKRLQRKRLTPADYRFHFYPWWADPGYRIPHKDVVISLKDHEYFDDVEAVMDCDIDLDQRAWYVAKRDEEFGHEPELMWREYPSTPDECWKSGIDGKYLAHVIAAARREGRIGRFPHRPGFPVNGFWDIGTSDTTVLWLHQHFHGKDYWIGHRAAEAEGYLPFLLWFDRLEYIPGTMFLPHDAEHQVTINAGQKTEQVTSILTQLRDARPTWDWQIVPRVSNIQHGIDLMRRDFAAYYFDEEACKEGIGHLENYSRQWNTRLQCWGNQPEHDDASHHADALRQKAQGYQPSFSKPPKKRTGVRRSGMVA